MTQSPTRNLVLQILEILQTQMVKIDKVSNCVIILKRPQQAVRNDILEMRTEMISANAEFAENQSTAP